MGLEHLSLVWMFPLVRRAVGEDGWLNSTLMSHWERVLWSWCQKMASSRVIWPEKIVRGEWKKRVSIFFLRNRRASFQSLALFFRCRFNLESRKSDELRFSSRLPFHRPPNYSDARPTRQMRWRGVAAMETNGSVGSRFYACRPYVINTIYVA